MEIKITFLNNGNNTVKEFKGGNAIVQARDYFIGLAPVAPVEPTQLAEDQDVEEDEEETISEEEQETEESTIAEIDLTNKDEEAKPWYKKVLS